MTYACRVLAELALGSDENFAPNLENVAKLFRNNFAKNVQKLREFRKNFAKYSHDRPLANPVKAPGPYLSVFVLVPEGWGSALIKSFHLLSID